MYNLLFEKLREKISISPDEFEHVKPFFKPKNIRKRQLLFQEGDIAKNLAFVNKGALRLFTVDSRGNDISIQFALEGWWTTDNYSFLTGEPSLYNVEALEDSDLLLLQRADYDNLFDVFPKFERYVRILLQNNFIASQRRLVSSISQAAELKYTTLFNSYPELVRRVPQHMIASYLGITPETLSRIRKQLVKS